MMIKIDRMAASSAIAAATSADNFEEWMRIFNIIVKKDGTIRASKPKPTKKYDAEITGKAAYVWRMVVFAISRNPRHQCIPYAADFDIVATDPETGRWSSAIAFEISKELKPIEDAIVNTVPVRSQPGTMAWGRAFGMV